MAFFFIGLIAGALSVCLLFWLVMAVGAGTAEMATLDEEERTTPTEHENKEFCDPNTD